MIHINAGILTESINLSQLGLSIGIALNNIFDKYHDTLSVTVFFQEWAKPPITPKFCAMQKSEAWGFKGPIIATSLYTTMTLLNCPCPSKKYFYVWNLEWLYASYNYKELQSIYQHDDIHLIARSQSHYDILTKCWQRPVATMENFDDVKLAQILQGQL